MAAVSSRIGSKFTKKLEESHGHVIYQCEREGALIRFESRDQIASVVSFCEALPAWRADAAKHAAEQLTPMWNDEWRDDDEIEATPGQFAARLVLTEVYFNVDGSIEFSFDDSEDRLGGHGVCISWSDGEWGEADF
jgi:hypothetical protein